MKYFFLLCFTLLSLTLSAKKSAHSSPEGVCSYDIYQDGKNLYLLTAQQIESQYQIYLQHSTDEGETWSQKQRITTDSEPPRGPHFGNDIQIAASGLNIIIIWQIEGTGFMGSGPMRYTYSNDSGLTWKKGLSPADTGSLSSESFVDIAADAQGHFHLTWLDTRDEKRGLRYSSSKNGGKHWSKNQTIDELTCQCCWNTILCANDKVYILYRDESPRDMALATLENSHWSINRSIGDFNWQFNGCPHVGGSLILDQNKNVHCTVWNANTANEGLYYLQQNKDQNWIHKQRLGAAFEARTSSLAIDKQGRILVTWDSNLKGAQTIQYMSSDDKGQTWSSQEQVSSSLSHHPKSIATSKGFLVFWIENNDKKNRVNSLRITR